MAWHPEIGRYSAFLAVVAAGEVARNSDFHSDSYMLFYMPLAFLAYFA